MKDSKRYCLEFGKGTSPPLRPLSLSDYLSSPRNQLKPKNELLVVTIIPAPKNNPKSKIKLVSPPQQTKPSRHEFQQTNFLYGLVKQKVQPGRVKRLSSPISSDRKKLKSVKSQDLRSKQVKKQKPHQKKLQRKGSQPTELARKKSKSKSTSVSKTKFNIKMSQGQLKTRR